MRRSDIKELPSQEELLRLFNYDPDSGVMSWRANPKHYGTASGKLGTVSSCGYLYVGVRDGHGAKFKTYIAHRIIWKMMTGEDPVDQIDHIDGDRLNNRWSNLRPADNGKNRWNSKLAKNNKSGVKGVCWDTSHRKWNAYISIGGKQSRLGRFDVLDDAAAVVNAVRINLHGDFARAR